MKVRLINKEKDFKQIDEWKVNRGISPANPKYFPDFGVIVDDIFAAFIYETNTPLAFMENFISNPNSSKEERKQAMILFDEYLNKECINRNIEAVIGRTKVETIIDLSMKSGWEILEESTMLYKKYKGCK